MHMYMKSHLLSGTPTSVETNFTVSSKTSHSSLTCVLSCMNSRGGGGGKYSHILAIWVCATGKGMAFKPSTLR